MAATGQTINDRLNAVRYALAGQGLARTVCKATTEEVLGPKKKHIDYLLACTDEPNVSIPQLANLLIDRSQHTSWTVVFKSLITIHHLLNYGNERFTQYLATSNHSFELNDFMDRTTPQGYGMSTYVRRYAKYISNKITSYKTLAIDLCKVKPGKDNGLRTMNMDNLSKTLPVVHNQFDSLLDFGVEAKDLNNGIIMAAFRLLYKDLNRIFVAYQEAIINLIERYFKLSRKKTREALNMYKKYLDRIDKVANFFKIVEQVGLDKSEMPDTSKLNSLLTVLEDHMAQLEAKKRGTNVTSPDADDDGDDPVTPNKESQDLAVKNEQSKQQHSEESQTKAKETSELPQTVPTSSSSNDPPRKSAPPARPSPVKLPKAPHSDPKPTPSGTTTQDGEKKGPPERPSKPPSRPPPPSSSAQAPATTTKHETSAVVQTPNDSSVEPTHDDKEQDQAPTIVSPTPPTRPSPTRLSQAQESESVSQVDSEQATAANAPQANGSGSSHNEAGSNLDEPSADSTQQTGDDATNSHTCSNTINETTEQEVGEAQVNGEVLEEQPVNTNHVSTNNVVNHGHAIPDGEIEPPPPPPPIED